MMGSRGKPATPRSTPTICAQRSQRRNRNPRKLYLPVAILTDLSQELLWKKGWRKVREAEAGMAWL
jgi:hypothetical protein